MSSMIERMNSSLFVYECVRMTRGRIRGRPTIMASLQSKMMEGARSSERLVALALYGQHWPWVNMHETTNTVGDGDICISLARARGVTFSSFVISLSPTVMAMDSSSLPPAAELEQCSGAAPAAQRRFGAAALRPLRTAVMALTDSSSVEDLSDAVEGMKLSADLNVDSKQGGVLWPDAKKAQKSKADNVPPLAGNRAVDGGVLHLDGRPVDSSNSGKPPRYWSSALSGRTCPIGSCCKMNVARSPGCSIARRRSPSAMVPAMAPDSCRTYHPPAALLSIGAAIICPGATTSSCTLGRAVQLLDGRPRSWEYPHSCSTAFCRRAGCKRCRNTSPALSARRVHANGGPVVACGFSAGGHLIASSSTTDAAQSDHACRADLQLLVYPCINPDGWLLDDECGFWRAEVDMPQVRSL